MCVHQQLGVPVHTTRLEVRADDQVELRSRSGEGKVIVLGPELGLTQGASDLVPVQLISLTERTAGYEVDIRHQRVTRFTLDTDLIRSDGKTQTVWLKALDHRGRLDTGDDTTKVAIRVSAGGASLTARSLRLDDGMSQIGLSAGTPGEIVLTISAPGIPDQQVVLLAGPGATIDVNPAPGNQAATRVERSEGEMLSIDVYSDPGTDDIRGVHYRVDYDVDALTFDRVMSPPAMLDAESIVSVADGTVDVSAVLLGGQAHLTDGWMGRVLFRVVQTHGSTAVQLKSASLGLADGRIEPVQLPDASTVARLEIVEPLSFDRLGQLFGLSKGDPAFDPRYDLDQDGEIAFTDFIEFATRLSY